MQTENLLVNRWTVTIYNPVLGRCWMVPVSHRIVLRRRWAAEGRQLMAHGKKQNALGRRPKSLGGTEQRTDTRCGPKGHDMMSGWALKALKCSWSVGWCSQNYSHPAVAAVIQKSWAVSCLCYKWCCSFDLQCSAAKLRLDSHCLGEGLADASVVVSWWWVTVSSFFQTFPMRFSTASVQETYQCDSSCTLHPSNTTAERLCRLDGLW